MNAKPYTITLTTEHAHELSAGIFDSTGIFDRECRIAVWTAAVKGETTVTEGTPKIIGIGAGETRLDLEPNGEGWILFASGVLGGRSARVELDAFGNAIVR